MTPLLDVSGAAFDCGVTQGRHQAGRVAAWVEDQLRPFGWLGRREAGRAARLGPGRALERHLVQEHERLRGIALGARVPAGALELADLAVRVNGVGGRHELQLEGRLDVPDALAPLLRLRRSRPDAVGFESIELCALPLGGCLAGVNVHGVGVVVLEDRCIDQIPVRALAQDLLLRASELDAGLRHLELRAGYAGGTGALLVGAASGEAYRIELDSGALRVAPLPSSPTPVPASTVRLDLAERTLTHTTPDASTQASFLS